MPLQAYPRKAVVGPGSAGVPVVRRRDGTATRRPSRGGLARNTLSTSLLTVVEPSGRSITRSFNSSTVRPPKPTAWFL